MRSAVIIGQFDSSGRMELTPPLNVNFGEIEFVSEVIEKCL